jgi:hypothetical protein
MGYRDNPINRPTGVRILRDIYDLIYLKNPGSGTNSANRLATENSQMPQIVSNFKQNAPRIVMMMRRFMTGNTHVQTSNAGDSGIFICNPIPFGLAGTTGGGARGAEASASGERGCGRRDFLWWWEFADFGVYNNYSNWGHSVGLVAWSANLHDPTYRNQNFQLAVARIRCNTVNTCDPESGGCGNTWRGSGSCPSPYCRNSRPKSAGCGRENYAIFKISLNDPLRNYWTTGARHQNSLGETTQYVNGAPIAGANNEMPPKMVGVLNNNRFVEDPASSVNYYRFYWAGLPPENTYLSTQESCLKHIPYLQVGYRSLQDTINTRPNGYTCNLCAKERFAPLNGADFDVVVRPTFATDTDSFVDQSGGLCKNIGDRSASYAGVSGQFGCACGGVFEPNLKIPAFPANLKTIHDAIVAAQKADMDASTVSSYARDTRGGLRAGSGTSSGWATSQRGDVRQENTRAVYQQYGTDLVRDATSMYNRIKELQTLRRKNAFPATFPVSMCRYGFVRDVLKVCKNPTGSHQNHQWRMPGSNTTYTNSFVPLIDGNGQAMDYCPVCGANGDPKHIQPHPERWICPTQPYTIMNRQPLTEEDAVGLLPGGQAMAQAVAEKPQWSIVVKSQTDMQERYNLRIELPQIYLGDIVPSGFQPQPSPPPSSGRDYESFVCPNERAGPLEYEINWLNTNTTSAQPAPSADSLREDQTLITENYRVGESELSVSHPERISVGDYINADGVRVGTSVTAIAGNRVTISTQIMPAQGNLDAATGRPAQITEFVAPQVATIVQNPISQTLDPDSPFAGVPISCCSGRGSNYLFLVTEGRSREAYYSTTYRRWIDISPLVQYADGTVGQRWTQFPAVTGTLETTGVNWTGAGLADDIPLNASLERMQSEGIPSDYTQQSETGYDFCHLDDDDLPQAALMQDMFGLANRALRQVMTVRTEGFSSVIQGTHRIRMVESQVIPQNNLAVNYYQCSECERISQIGQAAAARGQASSLREALENNLYYPGYAAITHYINTGQLERSTLFAPDGNIQLLPTITSGLSQGYLEGAVQWEIEPTTDVVEESGQARQVAIPGGWWKWALRFRAELVEGGDYRF